MVMQALTCPNCGAPVRTSAQAVVGVLTRCGFCGTELALASPAPRSFVAIELTTVGPRRLEIIKCIRSFSDLGLAETVGLLDKLPATISITERDIVPSLVLKELEGLGCVASLSRESALLPSDPAFAGHEGTWGFRIVSGQGRTIEAIKLVRDYSGMGLAEAKSAYEQHSLVPIARASASHEQIRRRFAELGYVVSFSPSGG
jgi:ribosomal protein L7/L12